MEDSGRRETRRLDEDERWIEVITERKWRQGEKQQMETRRETTDGDKERNNRWRQGEKQQMETRRETTDGDKERNNRIIRLNLKCDTNEG